MIVNQWYAILPSRDVKPGKVVSALRLNLRLALFRKKNGELGCVVDQCSHRGAALSGGRMKDDCLQCPFHGLRFQTNGNCSFVPANGKSSVEDLSRFHVRSYAVREAHGMIYIWYGDDESVYADALPFFEEYLDDGYAYSMFSDHWNAHYSRCIENQLDVVHLPFVHYNTIGRGNKTLVNGPAVEFNDGLLLTSASNEPDHGQTPKNSEESTVGRKTFLGFCFPNVWINHIAPLYKLVIFFAPVDEENTILYIQIYSKISSLRVVNRAAAWASRLMAYIIERQDRRVVITQKPKASSYRGNEKLLKGDIPIVIYRRKREELKGKAGHPETRGED